MNELFIKYPIGSIVVLEGDSFAVIGYEIYSNMRYLICMECGCDLTLRINCERIKK